MNQQEINNMTKCCEFCNHKFTSYYLRDQCPCAFQTTLYSNYYNKYFRKAWSLREHSIIFISSKSIFTVVCAETSIDMPASNIESVEKLIKDLPTYINFL